MGDWSAVPARCQILFGRGRQQRAFGRSSEDSVEIVYHVGLIGKATSIGNVSPSQSASPLEQDLLDSYTTRKLLRGYPNYATEPAQQLSFAYMQARGKSVNARRRIAPQAGCGATYHGIWFVRTHANAQKVRYCRHAIKARRRLGDDLFEKLDVVSMENVTEIDFGI